MLYKINNITPLYFTFKATISALLLIIVFLVMIAFFTLYERKYMAQLQRRVGPNVAGYLGLLQPVADGLKLILKKQVTPERASSFIFKMSPIVAFGLSFSYWPIMPTSFFGVVSDINLGALVVLGLSGLGLYPIVLGG